MAPAILHKQLQCKCSRDQNVYEHEIALMNLTGSLENPAAENPAAISRQLTLGGFSACAGPLSVLVMERMRFCPLG